MIVVDSSAVMAVLLSELDADQFREAFEQLEFLSMSAGTLVELGTVALHRQGSELLLRVYRFLEYAQIEIIPVSDEHARRAIDAYSRFGRGTGHPAGLNFGDCFAYALARADGAPLLYKGGDFALTDIRSAL